MQLLGDVLKKASTFLKDKGVAESRLSAEWLLADILHMNRMDLYLNFDRPLSEEELNQYRSRIARRVRHEPISYIMGEHPFLGLNLVVNQSVLIPRSETEELVELALQMIPKDQQVSILDLCTGSGAIACAIKKNRPLADVHASDISPESLKVAKLNAHNLGLSITFHESNLLAGIHDRFDVVISNPPYISSSVIETLDPQVRLYEPRLALDGGGDGLNIYRDLKETLPKVLKHESIVFLEIGFDQKDVVIDLFSNEPYHNPICIKDSNLNNRFVIIEYKSKKV
jgi:release factor glutamine methyltransferase